MGCIEYADVSDIYVEHIVDGRTADVSGDIDGESLTEIFSGTGSKLFLDATGPYSRDDAEWLIMVSGNANKSYVVILGKKNYWYVPNQLFCNKIYDAGKIKAALMAMAG
ncbi:MAG: hypothetical protein LBG82_06980 [Clostridiales Family XIII bacterium]|nr:hypothetical protein [Clostridiales Family XIII bacterium]